MTGETYINGQDAYSQWGVTLGYGSLTALMNPAPLKEYITNESPASDGKSVYDGAAPKVGERDIQLTFFLRASSKAQFLAQYAAFVAELQKGFISIKTKYQPGVVYRCTYLSCQQFSQFNGKLAKFVLRVNEPNPKNRAE